MIIIGFNEFNEIVIPRFGWNFSLPGLGACGRV
jgi:hypothetical protein